MSTAPQGRWLKGQWLQAHWRDGDRALPVRDIRIPGLNRVLDNEILSELLGRALEFA